jgi:hypothetical protein
LLRDQFALPEQLPRSFDLRGLAQHELTLAVVAKTPCLYDKWQTDGVDCITKILQRIDRVIRRQRNIETIEQPLFQKPVLCLTQRGAGRVNRNPVSDRLQCVDRNVLEFIRKHVRRRGQRHQCLHVVEISLCHGADNGSGRRRRRVEKPAAVSQVPCSETEHLAELASANNADAHAIAT